jgi:hypothetical protein
MVFTVVSFDVGSKHLAVCKLQFESQNSTAYTIPYWDVLSCVPKEMNVNKTPIQDIVPLFGRLIQEHKTTWLFSGNTEHGPVDHILIEAQPMGAGRGAIRNLKTKILSHILQAYLDPLPITFVHPSLKLTHMARGDGKSTYRENKKFAVDETIRLLSSSESECTNAAKALETFVSSKTKKDDYADSFLQGLYAGRMIARGDLIEPIKKNVKTAKKATEPKKPRKTKPTEAIVVSPPVDLSSVPANLLDIENDLPSQQKKRKRTSNK